MCSKINSHGPLYLLIHDIQSISLEAVRPGKLLADSVTPLIYWCPAEKRLQCKLETLN